ncbi:MAG: amidase [Deltaproteobacteria bacterium]|nr:amidase [Deltaproteobacteria bacterium]
MTDQDLSGLTLADAAARIKGKELSPVELTELMLARIDRLNPELVAYVTVAREEALADARAAEGELRDGRYRGPLHGIPLSIKDNIATRGIRTTAGSKVLEDCVPDFDATVVARLREAGAVILGKTNMHEWANGGTTINPFYGTTRNPWDTERIAGGSSGGSAAGVIAGLGLGSLGTDNGGSVRNPASLCGIVGLKPTYGRVSRFGHVPGDGGFSTNHVGVFSKTVRDCALILAAIAGHDPKDPNSADEPVPDYEDGLETGIGGLRVGIVQDYFDRYMTRAVRDAFVEAQGQLESLGATLVEVEVPHLDSTRVAWPCITRPENVVENLPYLTARPRDYSPRLLRQNIGAMLIPADAYVTAQRIRRLLCREFDEVFKQVDIIAAPTAAVPAPTIEESERAVMEVDGEEIKLEGTGVNFRSLFTTPFNLTGLPALSVNCGFSAGGLPIGLQLVGARFREVQVLQAAHAYEQAAGWYRRKPPVGG